MTTAQAKPPRTDAPGHWFRTSRFWRALPAGMRRRWWLFRPFDLIARHFPVFKRRRGLLAVRMDGIGDMVLFRASLDHYAEAFGVRPENVTVLGCESWGAIAEEVFKGYRIQVIDEHAYARRPLYRFRVNLAVRALAPQVTVNDSFFRRAMMADSLVWVADAPRTVVSLPYVNEPTRSEFTYYLGQVERIVNTGVYPTHEVTRHFRFVSAVSERDIGPTPPKIAWPERPSPAGTGAPYVVMNPGSNEPGRRWPIEGYLKIAERILNAGLRVAFVGTTQEADRADLIQGFSHRDGVVDLVGRTRLPELMDVMKGAAGVLTNDSGPAHLAIALGAPTVVVVGGGHFGCFFPYPDGVAPDNARFVYHEMECYHCFWRCDLRASKFDVFPCIDAVGEDQVWGALGEIVEGLK